MLVKIGIAAALSLGFVNGDTVGDRQEMQHLSDLQNGQDVISSASLLSENVFDKDENDRRRMLWGKSYYGSKYTWSKFSSKGRDSSSSDGKRSKRDSSDSSDRKKSSKSRNSSSSDDNRKSGSKRDSGSSGDDRRSSKRDDSSSSDGKRSKRGSSSSDSSDGKRSKKGSSGSSSSSDSSSRGSKGGKGGRGSSSDSSDGKRSKRKGSSSGSSSDSSDGRKGSKGKKGSSSSSSDGRKGKKVSRPTPRPTPKPTPKPTLKPIEDDCETSVYLGRVWSRTNLDTNEFYDYSGWYHLVENDEEAYWRRDDHSYVLKMELFDNKNYLVLGDSYDTTGSSKIYYYLDASEWNRYENPITTHKADENDEWFCLTQDDEDYYYKTGKYSKHGKHSKKSKKSKSKSKSKSSKSGANCKVSTGVFNVLDCNNEDGDFCDWDTKLSYFPKFLQCEFCDKKCGLMNRMFGKC